MRKATARQLGRWGPVLVWMALIFALSAQPQLPSPEDRWIDFIFEKSAHFLEYAVLGALFSRALAAEPSRRWRAWGLAVVVAGLYALSDEFHQSFVPGRSADWSDVLFDWVGAAVGAWAWIRWQEARRV